MFANRDNGFPRALPILKVVFGMVLAYGMADAATAQSYPTRPLRFITVSAPGSVGDIIPRVLAQELDKRLGQPVVVENRPGGSGMVGATAGAHATPDGYNILLSTSGTMIVNTFVYSKMPYDSLKDFEPVALIATVPLVLVVSANSPAQSVKDLVAMARKEPGSVSYGTFGNGSTNNITTTLLTRAEGVDMVQVPYKGSANAFTDMVAGRLTMMFDFIGFSLPRIRSGKLRALAVATPKRVNVLPDVPTMQELGYPIHDMSMWYAVYAPAGTPRAIVQRLGTEFKAVLGTPAVQEKFKALVVEPGSLNSDEFKAFQTEQFKRWGDMVKPLGILVN